MHGLFLDLTFLGPFLVAEMRKNTNYSENNYLNKYKEEKEIVVATTATIIIVEVVV